MSQNKTCIVCGKRGRLELVGGDKFTLCTEHNLMIEDNIINLLHNARLKLLYSPNNDLTKFLELVEKI